MVQNERLIIKLFKTEYSLFIRQLLSNHFNHHNHPCPNQRSRHDRHHEQMDSGLDNLNHRLHRSFHPLRRWNSRRYQGTPPASVLPKLCFSHTPKDLIRALLLQKFHHPRIRQYPTPPQLPRSFHCPHSSRSDIQR